jgi:hypothetical protein
LTVRKRPGTLVGPFGILQLVLDDGQLPALVDSPFTGTLNAEQREAAQALRAGIVELMEKVGAVLLFQRRLHCCQVLGRVKGRCALHP